MLRCREVTEVVAETKNLPAWRKPELWFHLAICGACRLYAKQMQQLKNCAKKIKNKNIDLKAENELINKIIKKLD